MDETSKIVNMKNISLPNQRMILQSVAAAQFVVRQTRPTPDIGMSGINAAIKNDRF